MDVAERARCRVEDIARGEQEAAFWLARADEEQARRAQGVAVTNTELHADVQRSFPRTAVKPILRKVRSLRRFAPRATPP